MIRRKVLRLAAAVAIALSALVGVSANPATADHDWTESSCYAGVWYSTNHSSYSGRYGYVYWDVWTQQYHNVGWSGYTNGTRIMQAYSNYWWECGDLGRPTSSPYWTYVANGWVLWQDFEYGFIYDRNGQIVIGFW